MKKLTKDQRYYRKKKKESERDIVKLPREYDGDRFKPLKVSRREICIRVSLEAFEKLTAMSQGESVKRWEMLSRILTYKIPNKKGYWYTKHPNSSDGISDGSWELFNMDTPEKIKYKGTKSSAQINCDITSTASNKLHALHLETRYSKARIVQRMILDYELPTEAIKQARKKYHEQIREIKDSWDTERERQGEIVNSKRSKFIDIGMEYIHVNSKPMEQWDDEENEEYDLLIEKKLSQMSKCTIIQGEES